MPMPRIAVLLFILLGACGSRATQAPSASEPSTRDDAEIASTEAPEERPAERIVLLFEDLSREIAQAGTACSRVAESLIAWTEDQEPGYTLLIEQTAARQLPAEQLALYEDRLAAAFTVIVDSAITCETHEEAQIAFRTFDQLVTTPRLGN